MGFLKKMKFDIILISSVLVALGVLILIWPGDTQNYIGYILALLLIAVGICFSVDYLRREEQLDERNYALAFSLLALVGGIIAIANVDEIIGKLNLVLSLLVLFSGFMKLQNAWDMKKLGYTGAKVHFIVSLVSVVTGGILLFNFLSKENQERLIGIGLIYGGFTDLISSFTLLRARRAAAREEQEK